MFAKMPQLARARQRMGFSAKPTPKRQRAGFVLRDPAAGELVRYESISDELAEAAISRANRWIPSPWWANLSRPPDFVACFTCPKHVPLYYRRQSGECEDCGEWSFLRRKENLDEYESRPWASQLNRRWSIMRRLRISFEEAARISDRVDRLAKAIDGKREEIDPQTRERRSRGIYAQPTQPNPLPSENEAGLANERELHELTGWVNDNDATADEVAALLALTRTMLALTGEIVSGISAGRMRGRVWKARALAPDISAAVPKTVYESADYDL